MRLVVLYSLPASMQWVSVLAAPINARWVNACGRLPKYCPV